MSFYYHLLVERGMNRPLNCSTVRDPAADEHYVKKLKNQRSRSLNRNSKAPTGRNVKPGRNNTRRNMATTASAAAAAPAKPNYTMIDGDILAQPTGDGRYIVQQTCCTCLKPAGLSEAIAKKWGTDEFTKLNPALNPYSGRKGYRDATLGKIIATPETRDKLASVRLLHDDAENVNVICLFAQYGPGKADASYEDDHVVTNDGAEKRLEYFKKALTKIPTVAPAGSTLYIPYGIGCGLAGGDWAKYEPALRAFAAAHKDYKVVVVHMPEKSKSRR